MQLDTPMTSSVYAQLNKILISLYASFGITDNNDSIFADVNKTSLKKMPILSDFMQLFLMNHYMKTSNLFLIHG